MNRENVLLEKNSDRHREIIYKMEEGFCLIEVLFDENEKPVDYRFLEVNPAFEKEAGLKDAAGKLIRDLVPQLEDYWFEIYGKVALTGESVQFRNHVEHLHRWYDVKAFRVGLPMDRQVAVFFRDITRTKDIESALVKNLKLLESTMDNFPTVIAFKDREGRFVNVNHYVEAALGMKKEDIIGLSDHDLFPKELADKYRAFDLSVMQGRRPVQREEVTKLPDGRTLYHLDISFPLIDHEGEVYGVGHISHDITDRKLAVEEAQARLLELQRSNSDLAQFAFAASHDLREPIRMIGSYSQLLKKRYKHKLDKNAEQYIDFIFEGALRLQKLVKDLLNYTHAATNPHVFGKVNLNIVISEVIDELKPEIEKASADISVSPLPEVFGDQEQLRQLFFHLLSNAVRFRSLDSPVVRVSSEESTSEYKFQVKDNGIGIKPEFHNIIFVVFQRLNDRELFPGTGIGLALSKRIVERHGGRIWVESDAGRGAAFNFTIPKKGKIIIE